MVVGSFVRPPGINGSPRAHLADMVYGTASKPFVLRTLLPTTDRLIVRALPDSVRESIADMANTESVAKYLSRANLAREFLPELLVAVLLMELALIGFVIALRSLARSSYGPNPWMVDFAPAIALALVPCFFSHGNYPYDFATLCFFTAGLALMVRERWGAYLVVFVLGCINKETTILLTLVFAIHFRVFETQRRKYLVLAVLQAALFVVVKGAISIAFKNNPGSSAEFHLFNHTLLLPSYSLGSAMSWLTFAGLIAHGWHTKPLFLRHAVSIMVPLVGLTFFLGYLDETRAYYEAFPSAFLLASHTVATIFHVLAPPNVAT
jgi:hypothetical protein